MRLSVSRNGAEDSENGFLSQDHGDPFSGHSVIF